MAEMNMPLKAGKRKRHSLQIDFTPMVDLGFLLITFFIFTTTMAKPKVMDINMPSTDTTDSPTAFIDESTITLIAVRNHELVYYEGALKTKEQMKRSGIQDIRGILLNKKNTVARLPLSFSREAHKLHVLIKPNSDCKYQDVVTLLDEMSIVEVPYYAILDISAMEKEWIGK